MAMYRFLCLGLLAWSVIGAAATASATLEQRLTDARAALVKADAKNPPRATEQTAAIGQLFDLLDEASQLDGDEAQALSARDLAISSTSPDSVAYAIALEHKARLQLASDRFADALTTAQQAQSIAQGSIPPDQDAEASVRITLARVLTAQVRYKDAIAQLEPAIAELDARHVIDTRLHAALQLLAYDYLSMFKIAQSRQAFDRAIAVGTTLEGADGPLVADDRVAGSALVRLHGDLAGSIGIVERALPVLREAKPQRIGPYLRALLTLGQLYQVSGDCPRAEPLYRTGIDVAGARPSGGGFSSAAFFVDLGECLAYAGHYKEAAASQERALEQYRRIAGADARKTLIAENDLAASYAELDRLDDAAELLRHVVASNERDPAGADPYTMQARFNLGAINVWRGRYAQAEQMYRGYIAHAGAHHALGTDYPRVSAEGLIVSLWAQGRETEAFDEAIDLGNYDLRIARDAAAGLDEQHTISLHHKQASSDLSWLLAIAARSQRPEQVRAAWALVLESRGLATTLSTARLAAVRAARDPQIVAAWNAWKQSDEALVKARVDVARDPSSKTSTALDSTERAFEEADRVLAQASRTQVGTLASTRADLAAVRTALPKDMLLVSYAEGDSSRPRDLQRPAADRHGRLYAFVATRNAAPQLFDLGPLPAVESAQRQWLNRIVEHDGDAHARDDAGHRLRTLVWDPITAKWPQKRVLIVPSATLERVPFAALPGDKGRFLVESGYAFHSLDHERDVLLPAPQLDAGARLSLIGAPDFSVDTRRADNGTRSVCAGLRGAAFTALPQAAREIDELRALWSQRKGAIAPAVLEGTDATEARAREILRGSRIVHFATHGIFLGDRCAESAPSSRGIKTVDENMPEQPQDLSALVLSGANRPATSTEDDGLLTSEEIPLLDLSGTDWAVLSACDTGIGRNVASEGVFGLRRAFRLAGAHTVVMSLWPVDDAASADWMLALYRARLQKHASTLDSVRSADLALIQQRRGAGLDPAPYYWAAFVAAGDWR